MTLVHGTYGNLADAALGEVRVSDPTTGKVKKYALSPAARLIFASLLAVTTLVSISILSDAPQHIAEATPLISDIEDWLVWGDAPRF